MEERRHNLQAFKEGDVRFLICTDVAARGLDIQAGGAARVEIRLTRELLKGVQFQKVKHTRIKMKLVSNVKCFFSNSNRTATSRAYPTSST